MTQLWVVPEELEDSASSPYAYEACKAASYVMWAFSGRKFQGTRTVTERYELPCRSSSDRLRIQPYTVGDGGIRNTLLGSSLVGCGCSGVFGGRHTRLRLRGTPVRSVTKVVNNGEELDSSQYKIINGSMLQLTNTSIDIDGIEVTYTYGTNIPVAGQRAARSLASELVKGWSGSDECMLPDRVTNVNRQGFSFTVMDPQDFLDDGRTGLYEVDLFLRASNPDKARKPARIFSPDKPKAIRVTAGRTEQLLGPNDWEITPGLPATWTLDLSDAGSDIFLNGDWNPQGQITTWNGATLFEFDPSRFQISNNTLHVSLTADETLSINGKSAVWDLYGLSKVDGFTILHILSSTIYVKD